MVGVARLQASRRQETEDTAKKPSGAVNYQINDSTITSH